MAKVVFETVDAYLAAQPKETRAVPTIHLTEGATAWDFSYIADTEAI
jgi:hypothetical protein